MTLASAFVAAAIVAHFAAPSVDISENPDRFRREGRERPRNRCVAKESAQVSWNCRIWRSWHSSRYSGTIGTVDSRRKRQSAPAYLFPRESQSAGPRERRRRERCVNADPFAKTAPPQARRIDAAADRNCYCGYPRNHRTFLGRPFPVRVPLEDLYLSRRLD
jgi:hypothetical protein